MKKTLYFIIVILGTTNAFSQTQLTDFQGTWVSEETGWWISFDIQEKQLDMFECYDGKELPCVEHQLNGDTLAVEINYYVEMRNFKIVLTAPDKFTLYQPQHNPKYHESYRRISKKARKAFDCHLD